MATKKSQPKHVVRTDALDLNPRVKYKDLQHSLTSEDQDYEELSNRFKTDAIARKVVAKPAEDSTRNGIRIVIQDDPEMQETYQKELDRLKLQQVLTQQQIFQRAHGDGYLTIGLNEENKTSLDSPVNPDNILDVTFLHAFGQNHIQDYATNDDPTSEDYGKEQAIIIKPTNTGATIDKNGTVTPNPPKSDPVVVDKSRYFHISLDRFEDDLTGLSILKRCEQQLNVMDIALESTGKMLREYTFKLFKSDSMMNLPDQKFYEAKDQMDQAFNTESMAFINSEDDMVKLGTPVGGFNILLDFAWQDLAAACDIPKSVLTGEQAGTLAGATQDVANYYDSIKATQEQVLKPEIEEIVKYLMYAKNVGDGYVDPESINWHIEFKPLWTPDDKTQADSMNSIASAVSSMISSGAIDPEEARKILNGLGNSSIQFMQNLDLDDKPVDTPNLTPEEEQQVKQNYTQEVNQSQQGTQNGPNQQEPQVNGNEE